MNRLAIHFIVNTHYRFHKANGYSSHVTEIISVVTGQRVTTDACYGNSLMMLREALIANGIKSQDAFKMFGHFGSEQEIKATQFNSIRSMYQSSPTFYREHEAKSPLKSLVDHHLNSLGMNADELYSSFLFGN